ncbi:alpha/beta fold hydrolase [Bosea sp. NPDC055332]
MTSPRQQQLRLAGGTDLSFVTAGDASKPALLLLHGFPSSSRTFAGIIPGLARIAYVIAPDLPGYGRSAPLHVPSFNAFGAAIQELLDYLAIGRRFIYLHDWGAPVGLDIAMRSPDQVAGLVIQNANAHRSGFGPLWEATFEFWANPTEENEAKATSHLSLEFTREQYTGGLPEEVAARIKGEPWIEDWRVMNLPGRMAMQRSLIADYANVVACFDDIGNYLRSWQPPALMLWGRHEPYFALAETVSWLEDLPRMEAHILDGSHFLLETHAEPAVVLMREFIERTEAS